MQRREFVTLLGGAVVAWPLGARAQLDRMRRVGILLPAAADDAVFQARIGAFQQGLALLGWNIGRNVRIEVRWATTNQGTRNRPDVDLVQSDKARCGRKPQNRRGRATDSCRH